MALLNMKHDAAYDAQYEELKGDIYDARGDIEMARVAYDKAINLQGIAASKWLKLKRQNLGQQSAAEKDIDDVKSQSAVDNAVITLNLPA